MITEICRKQTEQLIGARTAYQCAWRVLWQGWPAVSTFSPGRVCRLMIRTKYCKTAPFAKNRITDHEMTARSLYAAHHA